MYKFEPTEKTNCFLVRGNHEPALAHALQDYEFETDHGYVSIGFSDVAKAPYLQKIKEGVGVGEIKQWLNEEWGGGGNRRAHNLKHYFAIQPGDLLLATQGGEIYFAEVIGQMMTKQEIKEKHPDFVEEFNTDRTKNFDDYDLGFFYPVRWLSDKEGHQPVNRRKYADKQLTSWLKYRGSCIEAKSGQKTSFLDCYENFYKGETIDSIAEVRQELAMQLLSKLTDGKSYMRPDSFEYLVGTAMEALGATSIDKPSTRADGDADIMAVFEPIKHIIYIQAKFHEPDTTTDAWAVAQIQNFSTRDDVPEDYSTALWVVSSAKSFSEEANKKAKEYGVKLINGTELAELILDAGLADIKAQAS